MCLTEMNIIYHKDDICSLTSRICSKELCPREWKERCNLLIRNSELPKEERGK